MTSADPQALIEEARRPRAVPIPHDAITLLRHLADALEVSEAARRDLTDKIEALTERWKRLPFDIPATTAEGYGYNEALDDCAEELLDLVSGDKKEQRNG